MENASKTNDCFVKKIINFKKSKQYQNFSNFGRITLH